MTLKAQVFEQGRSLPYEEDLPVKTEEELAELETAEIAREAQNARVFRDKLLLESDWTQGSDSPLTTEKKTEWATYRAALRNLPTADDDWPYPTWPDQPT